MTDLIKRAGYFWLIFIPFAIGGLVTIIITDKYDLFISMNKIHHSYADEFFPYFTWIGNGIIFAIICFVLLIWKVRYGLLSILCFATTSILVQFLKKVIFTDYYRPLKHFKTEEIHTVIGIKNHLYHSFPSGHTTSVFTLMMVLTLIIPQKKWGFLFGLLAILGGYSRVYLSQHFFEDIYAGALIGVITTITLFFFLEKKMMKNKKLDNGLFKL